MTPVEALKIALERETEAVEFYRKLSIEHVSVKDLSILLMNQEEKHKKMIEEKIYELTKDY